MALPNFAKIDLDELLEVDPPLWETLRGARLFITGASGFFGRWMLASLLNANKRMRLGLHIFALTRNKAIFSRACPHLTRDAAITLVEGDVRRFEFPEGDFSHVVHLAASSDARVQAADPLGLFDVIVSGTARVLEFAGKRNASRFLFVSSGAVYGPQPPEVDRLREDYGGAANWVNPQAVYGTAKRAAEQLCSLHNARGRLEACIARAFAFIGPGMPLDGHFAAGNFIRDGLAEGPIRVQGDGTPLRTYLYASDLAWWLWKISTEGAPGKAYNVGGNEIVSIRDLAEAVAESFCPRLSVVMARFPDVGRKPERYIPDISRAENELGLSVRISVKEALQRTISWHSRCCLPEQIRPNT
jgi:dTDP-glucose 4,6-dehydratase